MKSNLIRFILRHRGRVLFGLLLVTMVLGWYARSVQFDNSIEIYFMEKDLQAYNRFLEVFGSDEIIAIAYQADDVLSESELELIDTLTLDIAKMPHVRRVLSLLRVKTVTNEADMVHFGELIDEYPLPPQQKEHLLRVAFQDPFITGTVLSRDAKKTAVVAEIDHIVGEFDYKVELLKLIRSRVQQLEKQTGKQFYIGGTSVLDDAIFRYNKRDQSILIPLMVLVIIGIIYVMFRQLRFVWLPLSVVLLSLVWTYGFMGVLGYKINVISSIIPVLLMGVAIADSMHLITDYFHETAVSHDAKQATIERVFINILTPCWMTSLTTVLGLLSLLSGDLKPIRQFGLIAAMGVASAFVITVFLLPVLLSWLPYPSEKFRNQFQQGIIFRLLFHLGNWNKRRSFIILFITFLLALPAFYLLSQLQVGTNSMDYFRKDDTVRRQVEWIDHNIGGTTSLEFLVDAGTPDALKTPALLRRMLRFQQYLKGLDGVTGVYSLANMVESLNRAFMGGAQKFFTIPDSQHVITQQLFLVEGSEDLQELVSDDYDRGRITARIEMNRSQQLSEQMPDIQRHLNQVFENSAVVTPTGIVYLMHRMEGYLLDSQVKSFLLAFVIVFLVIFIMLRSVKLGFLAIIPNILPIVMTLALMPLFGIHLDVGTVMIGAVALGLVVDDTIHFLSRLKIELHENSPTNSIHITMKATGRAIIFTSLVLSLGFLVLAFASFNPVVNFGILLFFLVLLALVFDLVVLPALLGFVLKKNGNSTPNIHRREA